MEPVNEIKDRLKTALTRRGMNAKELSEKTKIPKSSISQYMSGYAKPKNERIYLISKALDINPAWLLGYDVPMESKAILLCDNPDILDVWATQLSKEIKKTKEQILKCVNDSILMASDFYCTYDSFKELVERSFVQFSIYDWDYRGSPEENEKEKYIAKIIGMTNLCMDTDDVKKLYKLIELVFPEAFEEYNDNFIDADDFMKNKEENKL